jgi:hypothetical protein
MDERINAALSRNDKVIRVIRFQKPVMNVFDMSMFGSALPLSIRYLPRMAELHYEVGKVPKEWLLKAREKMEADGYVAKGVYYIITQTEVTTERVRADDEQPWDV